MKSTYLINAEYQAALEAYQQAIKDANHVDGLTKKFNSAIADLKQNGIAADSTARINKGDQPKPEYQRASGQVSDELKKIAQESATINALKEQVASTEQALAAAKKKEASDLILGIIFLIIGVGAVIFLVVKCS